MLQFKDVNILVVDDETSLREAIIFDFKRKGFNVFEAKNGTHAFEIVKNTKIDVVLTDVQMPDGDGVELLNKIKNLNPESPVVMFITGFAEITLNEAYEKGVEAVFTKPFDRKALFAAVTRATTGKNEQWKSRKKERLETDLKIDITFPDLNLNTKGNVLNLGRGGVFVALEDNFPIIGAKANLEIRLTEGLPRRIEGTGTVRWVRVTANENLPAGCGIEFEFPNDQIRIQILTLFNTIKTKSIF